MHLLGAQVPRPRHLATKMCTPGAGCTLYFEHSYTGINMFDINRRYNWPIGALIHIKLEYPSVSYQWAMYKKILSAWL